MPPVLVNRGRQLQASNRQVVWRRTCWTESITPSSIKRTSRKHSPIFRRSLHTCRNSEVLEGVKIAALPSEIIDFLFDLIFQLSIL